MMHNTVAYLMNLAVDLTVRSSAFKFCVQILWLIEILV